MELSPARQEDLLSRATQASRGGVSEAGRALQSHACREGSWLAERAAGGNAAQNTAAAHQALQEILAGGQVVQETHPVWNEIIVVRLPNGAGAVWKADGTFITFLERYTPRAKGDNPNEVDS
jgi:hypothetical protein